MGDGRDRRDRERERDRKRHRDRRDRSHSRSRSSSHAKKSRKNRDRSRDRSERNRGDRNGRYYDQDDQRRSAERGGANKRDHRDRKSNKSSSDDDEDDGVQVVDKSEDSSSKLDILQKLYQNSGFIHVAENVVQFLDNSSVARLRLVSKETNEFLAKIWQDRRDTWRNNATAEARNLCQMKFVIKNKGQTCIFEQWPDWKDALDEMNSKQIEAATFLLNAYMGIKKVQSTFRIGGKPVGTCSPLHYAIEHAVHRHRSIWTKVIDILIHTSLDFNTPDGCDGWGNFTVLLKACQKGSRECVNILLNNADKKGIGKNFF